MVKLLSTREIKKNFNIPILELFSNTNDINDTDGITVNYKYIGLYGTCYIEWQGGTTLCYPKKNFTIKFDKEILVNEKWGKHRVYCLKANWVDFSHMRNTVSAKLWGNIIRDKQNFYGNDSITDYLIDLPNCGAIDGFPCVIYYNGVFMGLYSWNIPLAQWLLDKDETLNPYIVIANDHSKATSFYSYAKMDYSDFSVLNKTHTDHIDDIKLSLNRMISNIIDNSNELSNYLDINGIIDYVLFIILIMGEDNVSKNYLSVSYDKEKWSIIPYDLDATFGNNWNGTQIFKYSEIPDFVRYENNIINVIKNKYIDIFKDRFFNLINGVMSDENVSVMFYNYANKIPEYIRYMDLDTWKSIPNASVNNINQIVDYYHNRLKFLIEQINNI